MTVYLTIAWLLLVLFALAIVILFFFKRHEIPARLSFGDFLNVILFAFSFVGLLVAIGSLKAAVETYNDAKQSGEEQKRSLDASRRALDQVVETSAKEQEILSRNLETAQDQQRLFAKNLAVSESQYRVLKSDWDRKQALLKLKPRIEISLNNLTQEQLAASTVAPIPIKVGPQGWTKLNFVITNVGSDVLRRPTVQYLATPANVYVDIADFRMAEKSNHNQLQYSGGPDLIPFKMIGKGYSFAVDVTVPKDVTKFSLLVEVFGENQERIWIGPIFEVVEREKP